MNHLDLERPELIVREIVRDGTGAKDRVPVLSASAVASRERHLARGRAVHAADLAAGAGRVVLPGAPGRKYPAAGQEWV